MAEAAAVYQEEEFEFDLKNMVMSRMERAELIAAKNYTELNGNLQLLRLEMQTGNSALKAEINALRGDMQSSNDALRAEIKSGDDALRAEINNLRTETQGEFKSVRGEIKALGENLNGKINELRAELKGDSDMLAILRGEPKSDKHKLNLDVRLENLQKAKNINKIIIAFICSMIVSSLVCLATLALARHFMR